MKKKILAALLCVCMVVMMLPALVLADDEDFSITIDFIMGSDSYASGYKTVTYTKNSIGDAVPAYPETSDESDGYCGWYYICYGSSQPLSQDYDYGISTLGYLYFACYSYEVADDSLYVGSDDISPVMSQDIFDWLLDGYEIVSEAKDYGGNPYNYIGFQAIPLPYNNDWTGTVYKDGAAISDYACLMLDTVPDYNQVFYQHYPISRLYHVIMDIGDTVNLTIDGDANSSVAVVEDHDIVGHEGLLDSSIVSLNGSAVTAKKAGAVILNVSDGDNYGNVYLEIADPTDSDGDSPEILTGTDSSHTIGSGDTVTIHCSGELSDFVAVYVDGDVVDEANYTLEEGSTLLTFTSAYLDTLSVGEHVVTLEYTTGSVDVTLTIAEKSAEKDSVPKTGASDFAWVLLGIAVLAGAGVCVTSRKKRSE